MKVNWRKQWIKIESIYEILTTFLKDGVNHEIVLEESTVDYTNFVEIDCFQPTKIPYRKIKKNIINHSVKFKNLQTNFAIKIIFA